MQQDTSESGIPIAITSSANHRPQPHQQPRTGPKWHLVTMSNTSGIQRKRRGERKRLFDFERVPDSDAPSLSLEAVATA
jgi:hypothetical protein